MEQFFSDGDALAFARNGGIVAYGLIPTWQDLGAVNPVGVFTRWLTLASLAGDAQLFARQAIVTATCGLGLVPPETVGESFSKANAVGKLIHTLAGAPAPFVNAHESVAKELAGS